MARLKCHIYVATKFRVDDLGVVVVRDSSNERSCSKLQVALGLEIYT